MRLIDGHILMERLQEQTEEVTSPIVASGLVMAQMVVLNAPTIDAEQVVRCKDCKWADWYKTAGGEQFCYCIETDSGGRTANDFCSYGERREP